MTHKAILIGVAGGTGSGKTSVARSLANHFGSEVALIEQDSYYNDLVQLPTEERALVNFDHPNSLDFELLRADLQKLIYGQAIDVPIYDYSTHTRSAQKLHFEGHHIIILEGILALFDEALRAMMDIKIFVDTADDIRIIRRIKRDITKRGRTLESVIQQYYNTVRPMHIQFVEPTKRFADIIVPEGGHNKVAIDILKTKISSILKERTP
jgi:uridine kinase